MGKENVPHLASAAKVGSENKPAIAAGNRCATQNPMRSHFPTFTSWVISTVAFGKLAGIFGSPGRGLRKSWSGVADVSEWRSLDMESGSHSDVRVLSSRFRSEERRVGGECRELW